MPLVVVCDGVGLGAGGLGGGDTVVGFGVGLADVGPGAGVGWPPDELPEPGGFEPEDFLVPGDADEPDFFAPCLDAFAEGLADALALGLALGVVPGWFGEVAVVVVAAEWLNMFIKPTTPTVLSRVARQVSLESLRRPLSRCALSRSRCLMVLTNRKSR